MTYEKVLDFFNSPFFILVGALSTIIMVGSFVYVLYLVIKGVIPVWYRLGRGLSSRKIAIFSESEYSSLKSMLVDSKVFRSQNITQVHKNDLSKCKNSSIFLVHWKDFSTSIDQILSNKEDSTALIVYAPQSEGRIDSQQIDKIANERNSLLVNFRGRLVNDIVSSLITTSFK